MAYDEMLADRIREQLSLHTSLPIEEKRLFRGLCFLVNGKMCINVSGDNLICRFDPARLEEVAEQPGFLPMVMKGKELKGYCYVVPAGFQSTRQFRYWLDLCLDFNARAKPAKKKKGKG